MDQQRSIAERRRFAALLHDLSIPRLTGSAGARDVEERLRGEFNALGYEVWEYPFSFSTWPARIAAPVIGALLLGTSFRARSLLRRGRRRSARAVLLTLPPLAGILTAALSLAVRVLPWGRVETANLLMMPEGGAPRHLIMAHRDSKSQPISTHTRTAMIIAGALAWTTLIGASLRSSGDRGWWGVSLRIATGSATLTGVTLLHCLIGNESPGALDNASGLVTLIGIAGRERGRRDLAFLLTDGEELWLAGAREAARWIPEVDAIINIDGIDDRGQFFLIDRYGWPPLRHAPRISAAIDSAAAQFGWKLTRRGLPPGILVDHLPLARAGYPAITIMHGGGHSLRRVHLPSDQARHLEGVGIQRTVMLVCGALDLIRRGDRDHHDCAIEGL